MAAHRDEPNPLRPYYVPSSIGVSSHSSHHASTAPQISSRSQTVGKTTHGSSARNILADMDYSDYLSDSSPSVPDVVRRLLEQAIWKYTSVFLAQPFEVVKTVLQVHIANYEHPSTVEDLKGPSNARRRYSRNSSREFSDESDPDSPSYFTSTAPTSHESPAFPRTRRRRRSQAQSPLGASRVHKPYPPSLRSRSTPVLDLKSSSSVLSCLSALWATEGAWGIWKGTNSTYIYSLLLSTTTAFIRSFFSAFLALPDPGISFSSSPITTTKTAAGGLDILSSPSPFASLIVAVSAAGLAGILLIPLDIARTKIILTPISHPSRSILATLRSLPTWILPSSIAPTTLLHSTLPTLMSTSVPLLLRSRLGIDPLLTPTLYAIGVFVAQTVELAVKLPIETVLRRAQMAVACGASAANGTPTVVQIGPYKGLFGTMRSIIYEEGESSNTAPAREGKGSSVSKSGVYGQAKIGQGQGMEGLWRGWRVGMWGLVGVWGAAIFGGVGGNGGEF